MCRPMVEGTSFKISFYSFQFGSTFSPQTGRCTELFKNAAIFSRFVMVPRLLAPARAMIISFPEPTCLLVSTKPHEISQMRRLMRRRSLFSPVIIKMAGLAGNSFACSSRKYHCIIFICSFVLKSKVKADRVDLYTRPV